MFVVYYLLEMMTIRLQVTDLQKNKSKRGGLVQWGGNAPLRDVSVEVFHYKNNTCMRQKVQKGIQRSVILPPTPDPLPLTSRSSFLYILLEICQVTDRHTQTHPQTLSVVEIGTCSPHCSTPSFLTLQYISDLSKSACQWVNFILFSGCISTV